MVLEIDNAVLILDDAEPVPVCIRQVCRHVPELDTWFVPSPDEWVDGEFACNMRGGIVSDAFLEEDRHLGAQLLAACFCHARMSLEHRIETAAYVQ
jgi:hypothetical protein